MELVYNVHSANDTTVGVDATVNGEDMQVSVACFEVELTSSNRLMGTITWRFIGADIADAKKKYIPGLAIQITA